MRCTSWYSLFVQYPEELFDSSDYSDHIRAQERCKKKEMEVAWSSDREPMKQWHQVWSHLGQAFEITKPVAWCRALLKNWGRIFAMETAGYWVLLKIRLLFSCLHGNGASLKIWPWLGVLSTLKWALLVFRNFSWWHSANSWDFLSEVLLFCVPCFLLLLSFSADTNVSACQSVPGFICLCSYSLLIPLLTCQKLEVDIHHLAICCFWIPAWVFVHPSVRVILKFNPHLWQEHWPSKASAKSWGPVVLMVV